MGRLLATPVLLEFSRWQGAGLQQHGAAVLIQASWLCQRNDNDIHKCSHLCSTNRQYSPDSTVPHNCMQTVSMHRLLH